METIDALNMDKSNVNHNLKKMMKQKVVSLKHKSYHLNEENFATMTTCQLFKKTSVMVIHLSKF